MANKILDTVHETARGLHEAGVMDARTMCEFDALCLQPVKTLSAAQIKRLRTRLRVSQAVFAAYLNTVLLRCRNGSVVRRNLTALR